MGEGIYIIFPSLDIGLDHQFKLEVSYDPVAKGNLFGEFPGGIHMNKRVCLSEQKNFALESSEMVKKWHFPALIFALFSLIIVQINTVAAASLAEEAIASWFQSLKDAGAKAASYDALRVDEAADTITIVNPQIARGFLRSRRER